MAESVPVEEHPYVVSAQAHLRNAEAAAKITPFPYALDAPVAFRLATHEVVPARIVECDPEPVGGWLFIEFVDEPAWWAEKGGGPLVFHTHSWPSDMNLQNGTLVFEPCYRVNGSDVCPTERLAKLKAAAT